MPDRAVQFLRKYPAILKIVRWFQPVGEKVYRLSSPLAGHHMQIPEAWVYPMVWGEYEPDCCAVIRCHVKPGMRAIDIGAHLGYHALLLKKQVGAQGEVICFEPLSDNRSRLQRNLQLNGYGDSVRIEPMAVADRVALRVLHLGETSSQASLSNMEGPGGIVVPVCALDAYCELLGWPEIHFIKLDIEGAESLAIQGMTQVIARYHPMFLIKAHGEVAREGLTILQAQGYRLERLDAQGHVVPRPLAEPIGHEHWFARQETKSDSGERPE
jgi:FkbM family methyltransferase